MSPTDERPRARFKTTPEDFQVEELEAYPASGRGEHVFVRFEKRMLTTEAAVRGIAHALGADPRQAGFAGMKDKVGVTVQTASFLVPLARDPETLLGALRDERIRVLSVSRHDNKLKPGHLRGNRFRVVLRGLDAPARERVLGALAEGAARGVPNAFGPQRFGRDGGNPDAVRAWIAGRARPPRDKRQARLLFSSLQSLVFNEVLAARVRAGTFRGIVLGDVAKKSDTGGLFVVTSADLESAQRRAHKLEISPTGPIFGASMRAAEAEAAAIESAALAQHGLTIEHFAAFPHLGEGTRRALRLLVGEFEIEAGAAELVVRFVLPKGAYATTFLGFACELEEPARERAEPGAPEGDGQTEAEPET